MDFYELFTAVPENIVIVSPEYTILAATDNYLAITMRKREDILGKHFLLEAYPDPNYTYETNPVKISLDKAKASKKTDFLDIIRYDLLKPDGTIESGFWEASHTPVLDEAGDVKFLIQKTSNVTEREKAKKEAQERENKFRFMADAIPQLITTINPQGETDYFNARWQKYTGLNPDEIKARNWQSLIHPDDIDKLKTQWKKVFVAQEPLITEFRLRDRDGNYRWFQNRTLPMLDEAGKLIMWVGSSTDIHDTRKMVQELVAANEQMAEMADQVQHAYQKVMTESKTMERLIMKAPVFFCILKGHNHCFELVNDQYQKLFPERELVGKTVAEALPEVVEQGFIDLLDNVYNTGEDFVAENVPVTRQLENGLTDQIYVSFIYQAMFNETGNVTGILVCGYNVTESFALKQKLQHLEGKENLEGQEI